MRKCLVMKSAITTNTVSEKAPPLMAGLFFACRLLKAACALLLQKMSQIIRKADVKK